MIINVILTFQYVYFERRNIPYPSFPLAKERVVKRSPARAGGESTPSDITVNALAPISAGLTHPDYASLVDPLFACGGKRVTAIILFFKMLKAHNPQLVPQFCAAAIR